MQGKIRSIVSRFPEFEEKIDFLFQTNENFRDLCSDYILCARTLQGLRNDLDVNLDRINEYDDLQQGLQEEILRFITRE